MKFKPFSVYSHPDGYIGKIGTLEILMRRDSEILVRWIPSKPNFELLAYFVPRPRLPIDLDLNTLEIDANTFQNVLDIIRDSFFENNRLKSKNLNDFRFYRFFLAEIFESEVLGVSENFPFLHADWFSNSEFYPTPFFVKHKIDVAASAEKFYNIDDYQMNENAFYKRFMTKKAIIGWCDKIMTEKEHTFNYIVKRGPYAVIDTLYKEYFIEGKSLTLEINAALIAISRVERPEYSYLTLLDERSKNTCRVFERSEDLDKIWQYMRSPDSSSREVGWSILQSVYL